MRRTKRHCERVVMAFVAPSGIRRSSGKKSSPKGPSRAASDYQNQCRKSPTLNPAAPGFRRSASVRSQTSNEISPPLRRSTAGPSMTAEIPGNPPPKRVRSVNHRAILTRECESSKPENAGCSRNPDGCAGHPDRQFPEQRIGPLRGTTLMPWGNWGSAPI
jgi:hypothetical protein